MKPLGWGITACALGAATVASAYQYGAGWGWDGGGSWGGYHSSTAAEGYARGMADVVRSAGQANLMNSEAVKNLQDARSKDIDNRVKWTESYFEMKRQNREAREAMRVPRLTNEDAFRVARAAMPPRLTTAQLDPVSGTIAWPIVLRHQRYADACKQLDALFALRARTGAIDAETFHAIRQQTDALLAGLQQNIREYRANDYLEARRFVESLANEARFPATG